MSSKRKMKKMYLQYRKPEEARGHKNMSISPWETDREPPPVTVSVNEAYLHELQSDAARWRYVRANMRNRVWKETHGDPYWYYREFHLWLASRDEDSDQAIDRLIEEAKGER